METKSFSFDLPKELIAQSPSQRRGDDRLMVVYRKTGEIIDTRMEALPDFIDSSSLLVFNDSKVRKARLHAKHVGTDGETDFLLIAPHTPEKWRVMVPKAKKRRAGDKFTFAEGIEGVITESLDEGFKDMKFSEPLTEELIERIGQVPLPPYINRKASSLDDARYQTIYAKTIGSVAAPTAGLHFTDDLFKRIDDKGAQRKFLTLNVGIGTFTPIRSDNIEDHHMHAEEFCIPEDVITSIEETKAHNGTVFAIGTTAVRSLEGGWDKSKGALRPGWQSTSLYITPGYKFNVVDAMFTNFHTPESSLIVLVSSFADPELIKKAYHHAVELKYRFFSYGDAMLML